jgi:hypothetical protein
MKMTLTSEQRIAIDRFLFGEVKQWIHGQPGPERSRMYEVAYDGWARGGRGYGSLHQGGTGIMYLRQWYMFKYKPGSKEWRPSIIIKAVVAHLGL